MDFSRIFDTIELYALFEFMFNEGNESTFDLWESGKVASDACNSGDDIFFM